MVGTSTARLGLYKPNAADDVDVDQDLNANYDKLDLIGKKSEPITNPMVKRNAADSATSATEVLWETLTVALKTNHWYEVAWDFRYNTTVAVGVNPNGVVSIRFKAGGSVATTDPQIARKGVSNNTTTSAGKHVATVFDVPADGSYTIGCSGNSGGVNTLNILASGGTDNTGIDRCLWVKDLGEK